MNSCEGASAHYKETEGGGGTGTLIPPVSQLTVDVLRRPMSLSCNLYRILLQNDDLVEDKRPRSILQWVWVV